MLAVDGGDAETVIAEYRKLGIDDGALALRLQMEAADSFLKSWNSLLSGIKGQDARSPERRPGETPAAHGEERAAGRRLAGRRPGGRSRRTTRRSARRTCASCSRPTRVAASASSLEAAGLYLDYSKNRITDETMRLLVALAGECGVRERTAAMFRGDVINTTEKRSVLHVALRKPAGQKLRVDGVDVVAEVHAVLDRMAAFADAVRSGRWLGHTGKRIRNVVNIGIGGSDLGPVMAYEALRFYSQRDLTLRFVSNVDATDLVEATRDLDAAETLFIVCSKTFTTLETLTNATPRATGASASSATRARSPSTSSPSRPTPRACRVRHRRPRTCSASGTGSAAATRWIRRSACRR